MSYLVPRKSLEAWESTGAARTIPVAIDLLDTMAKTRGKRRRCRRGLLVIVQIVKPRRVRAGGGFGTVRGVGSSGAPDSCFTMFFRVVWRFHPI
jgi:hypothetical protein